MGNFLDIIITSLTNVVTQIFDFFPRLIGGLILFLIGWLIAKSVSKLIAKLLAQDTIKSVLTKLADSLELSQMGIQLDVAISKVIYYIIILIFLLSATDAMGLAMLSQQISALIQYMPQLLTAIVVALIGLYFAGMVRDLVGASAKSMGMRPWRLLGSLAYYLLAITVIVSALGQAGIQTELITANVSILIAGIVGAFALSYGFASRNILAGFLSSYYSKHHYKEGQVLEIDGKKGTIVAIDNVSITLDMEDRQVIVPIHKVLSENVTIYK